MSTEVFQKACTTNKLIQHLVNWICLINVLATSKRLRLEADAIYFTFNYTKTLRSENECVMMVRKRSNHQMEDYISYAKRSNVSEIIIIDGNGIEKKEIN